VHLSTTVPNSPTHANLCLQQQRNASSLTPLTLQIQN